MLFVNAVIAETTNSTSFISSGINFKWMIVTGSVFYSLAFVLNSWSLLLCYRHQAFTHRSGVPTLLGLEMVLSVARVTSDVLILCEFMTLFNYAFAVVRWLLSVRNWWLVLICVCRTLAIFKPMWKRQQVLTGRVQVLLIIIVSLPMTVISYMQTAQAQCHRDDFSGSCYWETGAILLQIAAPVLVIVITSVAMVMKLSQEYHRTVVELHGDGVSRPRTDAPKRHECYQMRHLQRASRTIIGLALVFTAFETPTLLVLMLEHVNVIGGEERELWNGVCNILNSMDPGANFFILLCCSQKFQNIAMTQLHDVVRTLTGRPTVHRHFLLRSRGDTVVESVGAHIPSENCTPLMELNSIRGGALRRPPPPRGAGERGGATKSLTGQQLVNVK